jgi:hypothetical protein
MDDRYNGHSLASEFHAWMDFSALMRIDNSHLQIRGLALAEERVVMNTTPALVYTIEMEILGDL